MGVSFIISLIDEDPTEEQAGLFGQLVRSLRDSPTEYGIFEFLNAKNGPDRHQGLVFFQICREEGLLHAEVRIDGPDGTRMYAKNMEEDGAVLLLRRLIRTRSAPDLAGWKDITAQVFTPPGDEEFE